MEHGNGVLKVSWLMKLIWFIWVITAHLFSNEVFFQKYGPLSSAGGDIWYFMGVARGYYHLFLGDPLQWILPRLGGLSTETLFTLFLIGSNLFHLAALFLLLGFLRDVYQDESAAFWATAVYTCLHSSVISYTGSFHHQQAVLPLMVGMLWLSFRWAKTRCCKKKWLFGVSLLFLGILGVSMGPDVLVWFIAAIFCGMLWKFRNEENPTLCWWLLGCGVILFVMVLWALSDWLQGWIMDWAAIMRGIDLRAQQALHAVDLLPFEWTSFWRNYGWLGVGMVGLMIWGILRGRWLEVALVVIAFFFSKEAIRFFYLVELGISVLLANLLAYEFRTENILKNSLGCIAVIMVLWNTTARGLVCYYPAILDQMLMEIVNDPRPNKLVWTTPNYGFLARTVTGVRVTTDWHHLDPQWVELATRPSHEAVTELKRRGVTHLFLTSYDFNRVYASGGFEQVLPKLSDDDLRHSLVYEAQSGLLAIVEGTELLDHRYDPRTGIAAVLYKID